MRQADSKKIPTVGMKVSIINRKQIKIKEHAQLKPLPHMPILGSSNSAANKDMISLILKNGDTIICLSRKHCGNRRNCS